MGPIRTMECIIRPKKGDEVQTQTTALLTHEDAGGGDRAGHTRTKAG